MRTLVGMLVALSLVSGGAAYGAEKKSAKTLQTKKQAKAKRAKKAGTTGSATAATPAEAAPAVVTPTSPSAPEAALPATTSTATTAAVAEAAPKRWSVMFDTWNEVEGATANRGIGDMIGYETLRIGYKLTPTLSASITGVWGHSWGVTSKDIKVSEIGDPYLMLAKTKLLGQLPAQLNSKGYIRFYPGLSEASQNKGQTGFIRTSFKVDRDLSKVFNLGWEFQTRTYFQQYKTYDSKEFVADTPGPNGEKVVLDPSVERANEQFRLRHFASLGINFSKKVSSYHNLGLDYRYFHSDENATLPANRDVPHREQYYAESAIAYAPNDTFSFAVGIYSELERDLLNQKTDFALYKDNESLYFLEGTVSF